MLDRLGNVLYWAGCGLVVTLSALGVRSHWGGPCLVDPLAAPLRGPSNRFVA